MRLSRQDDSLRRLSSSIAQKARQTILQADFRDTGCALRRPARS